MKALTIIFALLFSFMSFGQLEYVATYENLVKLIYIDEGEPAVFVYDRYNEHIALYAEDQSLITSFTIPYEYDNSSGYDIRHISRTLFDCDSTNIEYIISYGPWEPSEVFVKILRENDEEIFSLEGHTFHDHNTTTSAADAIIQTNDGSLIRFYEGNLPSNINKIYRACGTVPGPLVNSEGENNPVGIIEGEPVKSTFNLYPNPGSDILNIDYKLPDGIKTGELLIYNATGQLVHQRNVGSYMDSLIVDSSSWLSGRYEVVLMSSTGDVVTRSFIKVKD